MPARQRMRNFTLPVKRGLKQRCDWTCGLKARDVKLLKAQRNHVAWAELFRAQHEL